MGRHADRSLAGVRDGDRASLAIGHERDLAAAEANGARALGIGSAERLPQDDQAGPLLQENLQADLGGDLGDTGEHVRPRGRGSTGADHVVPGPPRARGQMHLVADQGDRLRSVQRDTPFQSRPGQLRRSEDAEPILLGGGKRIFPDDGDARALELVSTTTSNTGVLICAYRPVRSAS